MKLIQDLLSCQNGFGSVGFIPEATLPEPRAAQIVELRATILDRQVIFLLRILGSSSRETVIMFEIRVQRLVTTGNGDDSDMSKENAAAEIVLQNYDKQQVIQGRLCYENPDIGEESLASVKLMNGHITK